VFEGTWKGTKVALKVSPAQANSGVISELEVMINMRPHPNVIQLFGFSVHPETNSVILIIEFCDGGSLDGILYEPQPEPISFEQQLAWLARSSERSQSLALKQYCSSRRRSTKHLVASERTQTDRLWNVSLRGRRSERNNAL
jgi:serine/threonine protein kinase